jgi:hypothetical protein
MEHIEEWHELGNKLSEQLGICNCQRKIKSITTVLLNIKHKSESNIHGYNSEEYLICALLNRIGLMTHGVNSEYPYLVEHEFWEWLEIIKDDPNLIDN